jgi:hypothetical protein
MLRVSSTDLCASSDDLSDADKTAELPPISVQQLYVLILLGKMEQAEKVAAGLAVDEYTFQLHSLQHRICLIFTVCQTLPHDKSLNSISLPLVTSLITPIFRTGFLSR